MKLKCNFDLPEIEKLCWNEKPVVFDGDSVNRLYEIIKVKRKY